MSITLEFGQKRIDVPADALDMAAGTVITTAEGTVIAIVNEVSGRKYTVEIHPNDEINPDFLEKAPRYTLG